MECWRAVATCPQAGYCWNFILSRRTDPTGMIIADKRWTQWIHRENICIQWVHVCKLVRISTIKRKAYLFIRLATSYFLQRKGERKIVYQQYSRNDVGLFPPLPSPPTWLSTHQSSNEANRPPPPHFTPSLTKQLKQTSTLDLSDFPPSLHTQRTYTSHIN